MGSPNELLKKNFYINMGTNQGVKKGTIIDVHRLVMRSDPYKSKQTYSHKVKIGELKVLHSETNNAIATLSMNDTAKTETPLFEIRKFMIGDKVNVNVKD